MNDIFTKLEEIKKIKNKGIVELDTKEPYYIKGQATEDNVDLYKNCKDGSVYNLRFNSKTEVIYWWHNYRDREKNFNLSEGAMRKLPEGGFGFYIDSYDEQEKMQHRQGVIEEPTLENLKYLLNQTDVELTKLLQAAYPNIEISESEENIRFFEPESEVIDRAYQENEEYDKANKEKKEKRERLAEINKLIENLQAEKNALEKELSMNEKGASVEER